ncbi:uncharacterized protein LOC119125433 [Syngnathus acus]|uniref:uncharacterized protein LOC119125433 n=1 Tax=Syngnathus acus TaxID=161584 RepID=UPI0018864EE9|nr:uncharacterized protein LOC119125433 [Syngnathus acus]
MKVSGGLALWCAAALLLCIPAAVRCAIRRLNSIDDLKKVNFGQAVPKHSLLLLHWFANTVDMDNNDVIRLTFDPNLGTYGSHHYGNYERLLNPLPRGDFRYRYYTVGNVNRGQSDLPDYVLEPPDAEYRERGNRGRIVFRVRDQDGQTVDQVYLTQHYGNSHETRYDPAYTYQITGNLLRQIRAFAVGAPQRNVLAELAEDFGSHVDQSQLWLLTITWRDLACLGLLLYMIVEEKHLQGKLPPPPPPHCVVDIPDPAGSHRLDPRRWPGLRDGVRLQVTTGENGRARILWGGVPINQLMEGAMVVLYKDNNSQEAMFSKVIRSDWGDVDTSVRLNGGLQARLHKTKTKWCLWTTAAEEICRGGQFANPDKVPLSGHQASLQLFVKDGKACARLFVDKSFANWKREFSESWVAFYANPLKSTQDYEWWRWQWATEFKAAPDALDDFHDVYEYRSNLTVAPGIQARFILRNDTVLAKTSSWR